MVCSGGWRPSQGQTARRRPYRLTPRSLCPWNPSSGQASDLPAELTGHSGPRPHCRSGSDVRFFCGPQSTGRRQRLGKVNPRSPGWERLLALPTLPSLTPHCPYWGHGALSHRPSLRSCPHREGQVQVCGCKGDIPHLHTLPPGCRGVSINQSTPPHKGGSSVKGGSRARAVGGMHSPALGRLPGGGDVTANPSLQG